MFNPIINWQVYITFCIIALALYYTGILFLFYRKRNFNSSPINSIGSKPSANTNQYTLFPNDNITSIMPTSNSADTNLSYIVQDLVSELKAYLLQAGKETADKKQLATAIKFILKKYPSLNNSAFQHGITNLIAVECETNCNIFLNADELISLWNN